MSFFRESAYVGIVEFAIKLSIEGNALFSISDFKKQSYLSSFKEVGEAQKVKNCFWELLKNKVLISTTDYEEKEKYLLKDSNTGRTKQLYRRKNTTLYKLNEEFEFNFEFDDGAVATYAQQQINTLARVIISMMFFQYIRDDGELDAPDIINDIIAIEAVLSMPKK